MKFAIKTLGCKVNQSESDAIASSLSKSLLRQVSFEEKADIYIINTCAVTREAERKSRQFVNRALRTNPSALVLVTGCYARKVHLEGRTFHRNGKAILLPSVEKETEVFDCLKIKLNLEVKSNSVPITNRSRMWIKVEDGCEHFCSYCIVPHLRGKVKSREICDIVSEVRTLEQRGTREIVLSGINLGYYGKERGENLLKLIEAILQNTQSIRIRLSSLEPFTISKEFLKKYFSLGERACPHLHLPLQSGSNEILKKMKRGYSKEFFEELVYHARSLNPLVGITTDIIVGFPGETEEQFTETLRFCEKVCFSRMHIFPFSPRPHTEAMKLEEQQGIPAKIKREREKALRAVAERSREKFYQSLVGKTVDVLIENRNQKTGKGYSENYVPVQCENVQEEQVGKIVKVKLLKPQGEWMKGIPLQS
ncbi:tRNA (N(6)-L-threonylcarbamoyladenosine(37)-C(2))-methylthiotransferase MtaB [Atrimonas thermophila]|uniref:tRNA (N(6)-L-threonylcarbamoyladenosine(37)-C(2))- methylthiotransferase MtaB n=1 Tax=Atrimonas thermophila TaxID=3064161 RepID=UPI00399D54A5